MNENDFDRILYSESRSINTGDYEKHEIFFSFSTAIHKFNQVDQTATIQHSETEFISNNSSKEEFAAAAKKAQSRVKAVLDLREKEIRVKTHPFVNFETLAKIGVKKAKINLFPEDAEAE